MTAVQAQVPVSCVYSIHIQMYVPSAYRAPHSYWSIGPGAVDWRWTRPSKTTQALTNKRAVPNLDAIQSSGPGTSISGARIHLVLSWRDVTGKTPPPRRLVAMLPTPSLPYCHTAMLPLPSAGALPDLPADPYATRLPAYPPDSRKDPAEVGRGGIKLGSLGRRLAPLLPRHAAMQGPLQRRDWNRLR